MADSPVDLVPESPSTPPVRSLLQLLGGSEILDALRSSGLDRRVLTGFRANSRVLDNPLVLRRLEEAVSLPQLQDSLTHAWQRRGGELLDDLAAIPASASPADILPLAERYGRDVLRWGVLLQARSDLRRLALDLEKMEPDSPGSPCSSLDDQRLLPDVQVLDANPNDESRTEHPSTESGALLRRNKELDAALRNLRKEIMALRSRDARYNQEMADLQRRCDEARRQAEEWQQRSKARDGEIRSAARQVERLQRSLDEAVARTNALERRVRREAVQGPSSKEEAPRTTAAGARVRSETTCRPGASVENVIGRLLQRRVYGAVVEFAREAWEIEPDNLVAFGWLIEALSKDGRLEETARVYYDVAARAEAEGHHELAVEALCESVQRAPESPDRAWRMEKLLQTADPTSDHDLDHIARLYGWLKRESMGARVDFELLARRIRRSLWRRLPARLVIEHQKSAVEWPGPDGWEPLSASDLAAAVASSDVDLVERFRKWAATQRDETRQMVSQVIEGAAAYTPGARRVLMGSTRRVVVDGSNVAWWGRSPDAGPSLDNIRVVRQALFEQGYFPVEVLADASLPFQVRETDRLRQWELRGEIAFVEGRTNADETLVQEARRWECPIVTNDQLRDVDPDQRCSRIGFSLGPGGVVLDEK